jgi:hypothetical protein
MRRMTPEDLQLRRQGRVLLVWALVMLALILLNRA